MLERRSAASCQDAGVFCIHEKELLAGVMLQKERHSAIGSTSNVWFL